MTNNHFEVVTDQERMEAVAERLSVEPRIGFDLESNGYFRYPERVCLLQFCTPENIYLIDPLALDDMSPLGDALGDPNVEVVLHSGDHDVRSLDRDWGFRIAALYDTSIAAAFAGSERLGLASTLQEFLGVTLSKEKKIQRSDWSIRPLNQESLVYAAGDVLHLFELQETLSEKVESLGRSEWVREECERLSATRYRQPDAEMAVFGIKGSRDLDGGGLAILEALLRFRERHALRLGRPHFRVVPDAALVSLATEPDAELARVPGLGMFGRGSLANELRSALKRGRSAEPLLRPPRPSAPRFSRGERRLADARLKRLKAWRQELGVKLALSPGLLWPMSCLQRVAISPEQFEDELSSPAIRLWQRREFEDSLRQAMSELAEA